MASRMDDVHKATGGKCTVDSAFGKVNRPFLIKSLHDILVSSSQTTRAQREDIQQKNVGNINDTSCRVGMRSIQSSFPHLKDHFVYEEGGEQQIVLKMIVLLFKSNKVVVCCCRLSPYQCKAIKLQ
jgi:hypothetical protein